MDSNDMLNKFLDEVYSMDQEEFENSKYAGDALSLGVMFSSWATDKLEQLVGM